jgi:hypothetical protein
MATDRRRSLLNPQDSDAPNTSSSAGAAVAPAPQARQRLASDRAQRASGGGRRTAVTSFHGVPLSRDAIAGRPSPNAVTGTPQGQTLIAGPNRGGYDPGQDARANAVITSPRTEAPPSAMNRPRAEWGTPAAAPAVTTPVAPAGSPQAGMQSVEGGTGYKPLEAGTLGDPNKPGAHRVLITGPNKYETHMTVPWRDEEGVYGQKGAVYNVDSVIGHTGSPHSRPNFFPNPDYAAAGKPAAPAIKPGIGGFSMVGDVAGAPQVPDRLAPVAPPGKVGGIDLSFGGKPIANFGGTPEPQASGIDLSASNLTGMKPVPMTPETAMSPVDRLAAAFPRGGMPATGVPTPPAAPLAVSFGGGTSNQAQDAAAGARTAAGVSNAQAARVGTPTQGNPRPETETSPALDINKTDISSAGFLGGATPATAGARRPLPPPPPTPPPPPPEQQG